MANIIYTVPLAEEAYVAAVAFVANTVIDAAQPNITSVGNLTGLTVTGNTSLVNVNATGNINFSSSGNIALGNVGNVHITGGNANYVLTTDGTGNLNWQAANAIANAGTVTNVNTSGSGLGFSLTGGPITTTGTVTLTVPNATSLRSSLNIGNVANLNLNGNGNYFLGGNGSFIDFYNYLPNYLGNANFNYVTSVSLGSNSITANYLGNATTLLFANVANITTINATTGNFVGNISAGNANLGNIVNANYFVGNGNGLVNVTSNFANFAGNITNSAQPNITSVGTLISLTISGNLTANNANITNHINSNTANISNTLNGNVGNFVGNITAGNANLGNFVYANFYQGNGYLLTGVTAANANYASYAGNVTLANQPNITQVGTLTSLTVNAKANISALELSGNTNNLSLINLLNASEKVTLDATSLTGNISFDVMTQSVLYYTANATGNFNINFRGNANLTLDTLMSNGQSVTVNLLTTLGSNLYYPNIHQVDGSNVTPKWLSNTAPSAAIANGVSSYTYSLIKTGSNTFTIFGSYNNYK